MQLNLVVINRDVVAVYVVVVTILGTCDCLFLFYFLFIEMQHIIEVCEY
jgi:hypothetical protein